jgi:hypothetical protein
MWLNAKLAFDYGLYASHVFHEHHLLPLFATAIAFLHMTLAAHDRQTNIGGGGVEDDKDTCPTTHGLQPLQFWV